MERLTRLVGQVLSDDNLAEVKDDTRFVEDLGMNSLNSIMLITLMEREFSLDLSTHIDHLYSIKTVGAVADYLQSVPEAN